MPTETRRSTCSRDCPDACALVAEVRDNKIVKLRGDPAHPVTQGFLCFRTTRFAAQHLGPERIRRPLLRRDGVLVEVELDEALDFAARRLLEIRDESGAAAILHYRSGGSLGMLKAVANRFFEAFGPCTTKIGDICSGAGEGAQELDFGVSDSNDLFDLYASRHVLMWGKNPFVSNVHLVPVLREVQRRGARLTLIDPIHHRGVGLADDYVQLRPGADLEFAFGVARVLLTDGIDPADERTCANLDGFRDLVMSRSLAEYATAADVGESVIRSIAAQLADGPTAILVGWGMQRRRRGGATVRALDALSAISGNLFRAGGGCSFYFKRRSIFDGAAIASGAAARHVREPMLGADVLAASDPPIRAIWVTAGNPVAMLPDSAKVAEAFERCDFVAVVDPLVTDTTRRADVVFPAPSMFEDSDLLGAYGHHWIGESRPLVAAPAGIVHEVELFARLAERVGLGAEMPGDVDDWKRRLLRGGDGHGVTLERLRAGGSLRPPTIADHVFADRRVATASGRVELVTEIDAAVPADAEYPLILFSNSTRDAQASQWATDLGERSPVTVHSSVAAAAGLVDGDAAVIESRIGRMEVIVRVADEQRRDVAIVPKGGHFDRGQSANVLIAAHPTDIGLGAAYLDTFVRLRRP